MEAFTLPKFPEFSNSLRTLNPSNFHAFKTFGPRPPQDLPACRDLGKNHPFLILFSSCSCILHIIISSSLPHLPACNRKFYEVSSRKIWFSACMILMSLLSFSNFFKLLPMHSLVLGQDLWHCRGFSVVDVGCLATEKMISSRKIHEFPRKSNS